MNDENPIVTINNALLQIDKQKKYYNSDLSTLDGAISDLYHDIEFDESIDLYKAYKYVMKLKKILKTRRNLKEQQEQIKVFEKSFNVKNAINNMDRVMLKIDKEMPRKRNTRANDLLQKDSIELKNGWKV